MLGGLSWSRVDSRDRHRPPSNWTPLARAQLSRDRVDSCCGKCSPGVGRAHPDPEGLGTLHAPHRDESSPAPHEGSPGAARAGTWRTLRPRAANVRKTPDAHHHIPPTGGGQTYAKPQTPAATSRPWAGNVRKTPDAHHHIPPMGGKSTQNARCPPPLPAHGRQTYAKRQVPTTTSRPWAGNVRIPADPRAPNGETRPPSANAGPHRRLRGADDVPEPRRRPQNRRRQPHTAHDVPRIRGPPTARAGPHRRTRGSIAASGRG